MLQARRRLGSLLLALSLVIVASSSITSDEGNKEESWQECQVFLAPSRQAQMGWAVFAARDFQAGEIVELTPSFVPIPNGSPVIESSALDDYVYGYWRVDMERRKVDQLYGVLLGTSMYKNHHSTSPNVQHMHFGREPAPDVPHTSSAVGFVALRPIQRGEELLAHYGEGEGDQWFVTRHMTAIEFLQESQQIPLEELEYYKSQWCSKVQAGIGRPTWVDRILPILPPNVPFSIDAEKWLAPSDAGMGDAKALVAVQSGDRMERTTALVFSQSLLRGTPLAVLGIYWDDLGEEQRGTLRQLREQGRFMLQYQGDDTEWKRVDRFRAWDDVALLPVAGSLGMVRRVGDAASDSNCRIEIIAEKVQGLQSDGVPAGVTVDLIATKDISVGEVLKLNLAPAGTTTTTTQERKLLHEELALTGLPYSKSLFDDSLRDEL